MNHTAVWWYLYESYPSLMVFVWAFFWSIVWAFFWVRYYTDNFAKLLINFVYIWQEITSALNRMKSPTLVVWARFFNNFAKLSDIYIYIHGYIWQLCKVVEKPYVKHVVSVCLLCSLSPVALSTICTVGSHTRIRRYFYSCMRAYITGGS